MQVYQQMKDSGVAWLGKIPSGWNTQPLYGYAKEQKRKNIGNIETNVLSLSYGKIVKRNLDNGGLLPESFATYQIVQPDDIILRLTDLQNDKRSLRVGRSTQKGIITSAYVCVSPTKLDSNYLYYLLHGYDLLKVFYNLGGGLRQGMKFDDLKRLPVFGIDIATQQKIANFLDTETAKIDDLIAKQERLLQLLEEKRRATITHAVTRGLNPGCELKETNIPWLGQIPKHWGMGRVKHLIKELEAGTSVNASESSDDTGVYVLKTSSVYTRKFRASENKPVLSSEVHRVSSPVRKGAVVISRMNTPELVGAAAYVDSDYPGIYLPDRLWQTRYINEESQDSRYLTYFFGVQGFRDQISLAAEGASSSMQTISKNKFLNIVMAFPPAVEQRAISDQLDQYDIYNDTLKQKIQTQISLLRERRTSLISHAVTGKVKI